jgi:serine/threonine-protein kinase
MSNRETPTTIGPYPVLGVIGQGGMATVYHAFQPALARHVAIKVLQPARAHDVDLRRRFEREALLLARLRHPQIVAIHDVGEVGGRPYLVLEYVPGLTLHQVLCARRRAGQCFAPAEALALLRPLAVALDYLHAQQVIHGDLKPENVILAPWGPVLIDFGVAQRLPVNGRGGARVGTPAYMAPEQVAGQAVDRRTDVYALGILLYEVLTGTVPFPAVTRAMVAQASRPVPVPPLSARQPRLGSVPGLEAVVQRALAPQPAERWPSAGAMMGAVSAAVPARAAAVPGGRQGASGAPWGWLGGRRERLVGLVALTALLALGGGWARHGGVGRRGQAGDQARPAAVVAALDGLAPAGAPATELPAAAEGPWGSSVRSTTVPPMERPRAAGGAGATPHVLVAASVTRAPAGGGERAGRGGARQGGVEVRATERPAAARGIPTVRGGRASVATVRPRRRAATAPRPASLRPTAARLVANSTPTVPVPPSATLLPVTARATPTATAAPPTLTRTTATLLPVTARATPTATAAPPTLTPATATPMPATATAPPTATAALPTATLKPPPPTATAMPPTPTPKPSTPTATLERATATPVPPTPTSKPTATAIPSTATATPTATVGLPQG